MLLALALYASTAYAGVLAGSGGTLSAVNQNTPHYNRAHVGQYEVRRGVKTQG